MHSSEHGLTDEDRMQAPLLASKEPHGDSSGVEPSLQTRKCLYVVLLSKLYTILLYLAGIPARYVSK
jgi:hypothetical protein